MDAVIALPPASGATAAACAALGLSRASVHRRRTRLTQPPAEPAPRPSPPRALTAEERLTVLDRLREPRFADLAPAEVYATLLDEGVYLCSIRTHLVRNPGMVPNETICGVRRFHRVVFQRCVRCPPILHESFKKLE